MSSRTNGFWQKLSRPIFALSPMDGVTDFAFRAITAKYGRPHVMFTEFTTTIGMFYAPQRVLQDFEYSETERPVVAQIFGNNPDDFYKATHVVCELGFDGVDINMGCPAHKVEQRGAGAGLIRFPGLARDIIKATRQAIHDWTQGQTLADLKIKEKVIRHVALMNQNRIGQERLAERKLIPYSVKTRLGYDEIVIESWVENLLKEEPSVISIHGRTLKQMYKGHAQWNEIAKAVKVAQGSGTLILGNGDIPSLPEAKRLIGETGVDGVLIGRSSIGNPWVFQEEVTPTHHDRIRVALEHAHYFMERRDAKAFNSLKKHFVGYLKNFPDAASARMHAVKSRSLEELAQVLTLYTDPSDKNLS